MNNKVDSVSRRYLTQLHNLTERNKQDAFEFAPFNHLEKLRQYNQLQGSKYYV